MWPENFHELRMFVGEGWKDNMRVWRGLVENSMKNFPLKKSKLHGFLFLLIALKSKKETINAIFFFVQ